MTALPQATLPLRPRRAEKVLYGRKQRQAHNDAWGNGLTGNFDNVPGGFDYGFVGGLGCRQDPSSALVYMRARWYDPTLQRFISRDPIGLEGGNNLYRYAKNAPQDNVDSSGLYVDITRRGKNIRLEMTVYFCNDDPTKTPSPEDIRRVIDDFRAKMALWGGHHGDYDVTMVVNAKWSGKCPLDCDRDSKINYITLMKGTGTSTTGYGGNTGTWYAGQPPETFAHEAGHLMGLKDGYKEKTVTINGNELRVLDGLLQDSRARTDSRYRDRYEGNIMGDRTPQANGLDIQDILDFPSGFRPRLVDHL
ncbi:MAG: RHS repeat-associated core domain-containing protein [Candidatus Eremiobacteraeota bacterium]|nr:RHS repeat-associated core domain-containing protein [Candidatus Eremiobacteraeota bacterium]